MNKLLIDYSQIIPNKYYSLILGDGWIVEKAIWDNDSKHWQAISDNNRTFDSFRFDQVRFFFILNELIEHYIEITKTQEEKIKEYLESQEIQRVLNQAQDQFKKKHGDIFYTSPWSQPFNEKISISSGINEPQVIFIVAKGKAMHCSESEKDFYKGQCIIHTAKNVKEAAEYCKKYNDEKDQNYSELETSFLLTEEQRKELLTSYNKAQELLSKPIQRINYGDLEKPMDI